MKLGLALAGGGALGAYEVGAIKYLHEKGYKFDIVTGTSVGAINGAMVCQNDIDNLIDLWHQISAEAIMHDGVNLNFDILLHPDKSLLQFAKSYISHHGADIEPFKELCRSKIKPEIITQSKMKFGLICCNFEHDGLKFKVNENKILVNDLPEDRVLPFIHASSACFPVFPFEEIDDTKYIDGFYKNNLPIDYCFELGADKVIAIDLRMFGITQKEYYKNYPNVTVIEPTELTDSFMDFSHEVIERNMLKGYLDAKKALGACVGNKYYITKTKSLTTVATKFFTGKQNDFMGLCHIHEKDRVLVNKYLEGRKNWNKSTVEDYFVSILEILAEEIDIDPNKEYNHKKLFNKIKEFLFNSNEIYTEQEEISTLKTAMIGDMILVARKKRQKKFKEITKSKKLSKEFVLLFCMLYGLYNKINI